MNWTSLLFVLIVLACPLSMLFMGHGRGGGEMAHQHGAIPPAGTAAEARIVELEREVARLRGQASAPLDDQRAAPADPAAFADPVCGMPLGTATTLISTEYRGRMFFFCSTSCRDTFTASPSEYTMRARAGASNDRHPAEAG